MKKTMVIPKKAKTSLEQMLEDMAPFLPKRNLAEPEPARKWRLADRPQQARSHQNKHRGTDYRE